MVTRAVTGGRYAHRPDLAGPGGAPAPEAPKGHFVFRLAYSGSPPGAAAATAVELTLRHGLLRPDFNDTIRRGASGPEDEAHIAWLKRDLAERLLGLPAPDVFDATTATG